MYEVQPGAHAEGHNLLVKQGSSFFSWSACGETCYLDMHSENFFGWAGVVNVEEVATDAGKEWMKGEQCGTCVVNEGRGERALI